MNDLWAKMAAGAICTKYSCLACRELFDTDKCPAIKKIEPELMKKFVETVTNRLKKEEDIVEVLKDETLGD